MSLQAESGYVSAPSAARRIRFSPRRSLAFFVTVFIMTMTLLSGFVSVNSIAYAEDSPGDILAKSAKDFGVDLNSEKTIDQMVEKQKTNKDSADDKSSFGNVLKRLFNPGYLNNTELGVAPSGADNPTWNCDASNKFAGTPLYHNCDVPNVLTETLQDLIQMLVPQGVANATVQSAYVANGMGIPSTLPGNGMVPIKPSERSVKYTGLELFGYNMNFTTYNGEWDNIRVMTEARAIANYSMFDKFNLGFQSIVNGVAAGVSTFGTDVVQGVKGLDLMKVVSAPFHAFSAGASQSVSTVLDTSDLNVFITNSWYRMNYGGTLYRARELTAEETRVMMNRQASSWVLSSKPKESGEPKEYTDIKSGPPKPKDDVSKCVINNKEYAPGTPAPGVSKDDCDSAAKIAKQTPTWTKDGNAKGETLADWAKTNAAVFASATKFGITCKIDTKSEKDRDSRLQTFYSCWDKEWTDKRKGTIDKAQDNENSTWVKAALDVSSTLGKLLGVKQENWNAPWNRFVCVDADGKDILGSDGSWTFLYNAEGQLNGNCLKVRAPVQNGFFGNGYRSGASDAPNQNVSVDTRWKLSQENSLFSAVFDLPGLFTIGSNAVIGLTGFMTQLTNTLVDLSFQPLFQKIGLTDLIVSAIEKLRESVYFPLLMMVLAFSALQVFIRTIKSRSYAQGFKDLFLSILTIMLSIIALSNPAALMKIVDEGPAMVETAIAGTIFSTGNQQQDALCEASNTAAPAGSTADTGLDGGLLSFSPRAAVRTTMCQVWRVYLLEPYTNGQWGVSYDKLFAADAPVDAANKLQNTNSDLVGNAGVYMGGGKWIYNWGLYQVDTLTSGTTTAPAAVDSTGHTPRDVYRIVDAQAGPNNGAGTDGRYLYTWSGHDYGMRFFGSLLSLASSFVGLITVGAFAIAKLPLVFTSIMLLLFLPFILLAAVHPSMGRVQFKKYFGTLASLAIQRIMITVYLALLLRILVEVSLSASNYIMMGILSIAVGLAFLSYRNSFFDLVKGTANEATGGNNWGSQALGSDDARGLQRFVPRSIQNVMAVNRGRLNGSMTGAVGGFVAGGVGDIGRGIRIGARQGAQSAELHQRTRGIGAALGLQRAGAAGERVGRQKLTQSQEFSDISKRLNTRKLKEHKENVDGNATRVAPFDIDLNDSKDLQDVLHMKDLMQEIELMENREFKAPKIAANQTAAEYQKQQSTYKKKVDNNKRRIVSKRRELQETEDRLFERRTNVGADYEGHNPVKILKRELENATQDVMDAANERMEERREGDGTVYENTGQKIKDKMDEKRKERAEQRQNWKKDNEHYLDESEKTKKDEPVVEETVEKEEEEDITKKPDNWTDEEIDR